MACSSIFTVSLVAFLIMVPKSFIDMNINNQSRQILLDNLAAKSNEIKPLAPGTKIGDTAYVVSKQATPIDTEVTDHFTGISFPATSIRRSVEICQWIENTRWTKQKDSSSKKKYGYSLNWKKQPVSSRSYYDFRYTNPSINMPPDKEIVSNRASFVDEISNTYVELDSELLKTVRVEEKHVVWSPVKQYSFWSSFWYSKPKKTHYESINKLDAFKTSDAATLHGFYYLPDDGYFYSSAQMSPVNTWFFMSRHNKGTSECHNSGEIRMSYQAKIPDVISAIGEKAGQYGDITYITKLHMFMNDLTISTVYGARMTVAQIIDHEKNNSKLYNCLINVIMFCWCSVVSCLYIVYFTPYDISYSTGCWFAFSIFVYVGFNILITLYITHELRVCSVIVNVILYYYTFKNLSGKIVPGNTGEYRVNVMIMEWYVNFVLRSYNCMMLCFECIIWLSDCEIIKSARNSGFIKIFMFFFSQIFIPFIISQYRGGRSCR